MAVGTTAATKSPELKRRWDEKARTACFNSGQRLEDHFVDITEMVEIGRGAQRPLKTVMMSREMSQGELGL